MASEFIMGEETIAAIIGAAGSLTAAGVQAGSAAMANRRAYKWSKKYFDYQNQYNLENYSPAMQMQRLRDAGINPHEASGTLSSPSGSMSVPDYQNPIDPNAIPNALSAAWNMYLQKRGIENATSDTAANIKLKEANADKANQDAARIAYYNSYIQPHEAVIAGNKAAASYSMPEAARLQNDKLFNEISVLGMQKQKYQLAIDLMEIEKEFAREYYQYRNESVKWDSKTKQSEAGIRSLDLHNYQSSGIRPQDPYWLRIGKNISDAAEDEGGFGQMIMKGLKRWFKKTSPYGQNPKFK